MNKVVILLAAYNGAQYISEQIDSILKQTHTNWQLLVRDDQSSDGTPQILAKYQANHPGKIVVADACTNLGSSLNFNTLLQLVKQEKYIMFCDQDDFWLPDKIERTLIEMIKLEKSYGEDYPLLVHTNFQYVDASLKLIHFKDKFSAKKITNLNLSHFLVQNPVYGCTVMINRSLADLVNNIPPAAENHDYWIAMVASAFGKIAYLKQRTILYRQHGNNKSGSFEDSSFVNRFKRIIIERTIFSSLSKKLMMAKVFKRIYNRHLTNKQVDLIDNFISLLEHKSLLLFYRNIRNGVRKQTRSQTLLLYISLLLFKK